ncbi:MAG TPA: SRPBCC family protein [Solirubrobacteraceae bacterium]
MAKSGDVLNIDALGIDVELRQTAQETGGELLEFDVVGRARGFLVQPHLHAAQVERHEVIEGLLRLVIDGRDHVLHPGEAMEVPPGASHRQIPSGSGPGRVRVQIRPAGTTQQFLERLAKLSRDGAINRFGLPKPVAAAELVRDFGHEGRATHPPAAVQRSLSKLILGMAALGRPYVFVDEWDVAAPPEAVFAAIADARTYPEWWRPVYLDVEADGPAALGKESRQHFKGRLPYHLNTRSVIVAIDAPRTLTADVDGDLRGRGTWTLTPTASGTHVRFDWQVHADRRLLRLLTPLLRPLFRWNHNWAIARAMEGLEPYAQRTAAQRGERVTA